jgi:uncharacterized membrane protein
MSEPSLDKLIPYVIAGIIVCLPGVIPIVLVFYLINYIKNKIFEIDNSPDNEED